MNTYGTAYRTAIFGSSHGALVGCTLEGVPAGTRLDLEKVQAQLDRRRPAQSLLVSQRRESDALEILDGLLDGVATGAPIVAAVRNDDVDSRTYARYFMTPRPGHGDFVARVKYGGFNDPRGGGQLSGRMTAPLVISGAVARQILAPLGVGFLAHTVQVADVRARSLSLNEILAAADANPVRCADLEAADRMIAAIEAARHDLDSVGGVVEGIVTGLPVGVGEPFFRSCESAIAALLFSVPAVKGVEFGAGFAAAGMRGSAHNDAFALDGGRVVTRTNHAGGILGGIATGMPLMVRVAVKPTASIPREQDTVDLDAMRPAKIAVRGRHDPCIVPRAVPVVENALAMAVLDLMMLGGFLRGARGG